MLKKSAVATLTLFCFLLVHVVPAEALHTAMLPERSAPDQRTAAARETKPAHKVESELRRLERLFDRLEASGSTASGSAAPGRLSAEDRQALREAQALVRTEGDQILRGLGELSERLRQIAASAKIQERHARQVERVAQGFTTLADSLGRLSDAGTEIEAQRLGEARRALAGALGAERHNPVDPQRLPFRPEEAQPARLSAESARGQAEASTQALGAAAAPGAADLAVTPDVQLSPGIQTLAESLGHDPLAIYNWVRQNVLFVPTFGSIQGSEGCRLSRECNAHDSASLLIALLRASGVPARYVLGTVEVQPDRFKKIVGDFQDVEAAIRLSASGGIPTVAVVDAANQPTAVRIEHAWVEAFVNYVPSRGAAGNAGHDGNSGGVWVPLDPSLKATRFQAPVDLEEMTGTDLSAIGQDLVDSATPGPLGEVSNVPGAPTGQRIIQAREALKAAVAARPEITVGQLLGALEVDATPVPVLPASLPARLLAVEARTAELPAADRHRIILQNLDETGRVESVRLELATAEIAGRRLTLHYLPDTEEDAAILEAMGGFFQVPPHLIDVRPVLFLGGELAEVGTIPSRMGSTQRLRITFQEPGRSEQVEHRIAAGTFAAVGLDLQRITEEHALRAQDRLALIRDQITDLSVDSSWDDLIGEPLHTIGMSYFQQVEASSRVTGNASNVVAVKRPAEGLVTFAPTFAYLFGTAVDITGTGFNIDVRRYVVSAISRVGSAEDARGYLLAAGVAGSAAEHAVFETLLGARSVSAVKLLAEANARGIPIFEITSANLSQILPQLQLASAVRSDIVDAVQAGQRVLVPRQQLTFLDWTGVGYFVIDPETGAGGYLISGGLAGGGTAEPSNTGDTMDDIGDMTSIVSDGTRGAKAFLGVLRASAKAAAGARLITEFFETYGAYFALFSAAAAGYSAFQKTGDHTFAANVFLVDLLTSLLLGEFIGFLMAKLALSGFLGAIVILTLVIILSVIISAAVDAIVNYAASQRNSALAELRRRRDRRSARRRPRRKHAGKREARIPLREAALAFLLILGVTLPAAAQPAAQGAAFLLGSQAEDGSWESPVARRVQATTEGLRALQKVAPGQVFARALADSFLLTTPTADNDDRAQRLPALAGEGRDVSGLATELANNRTLDGGWGITSEFAADPLDTALALQALAGRPGIGNDVLRDALARLLPMQRADGGFPCVQGGDAEAASEIWCTGQALLALAPLRGTFLIDADVQRTVGFLRGQVDASGRFGPAGAKEVIHTALSALALAAVPAFGPEAGAVRSFLEGKQRPDGSWDGDPYTTALALRALDALANVPFCGDGLINQPGEACDGSSLGGRTCEGAGMGAGTLSCTAQCTLDTSACSAPPVCGDNLRNQPFEVCDGTDLAGASCPILGFASGQLSCASDCRGFDVSRCESAPRCGDGVVNQSGELCDFSDLNGLSCEGLGLGGGTLRCASDCNLDTRQCNAATSVVDNKGTEFLVGFLANFALAPVPPRAELHLTSEVATSVTVQYPVRTPTFQATVDVEPGEITVVQLPPSAHSGWTPGAIRDNAVRVSSPDEVAMYLVNRGPATSDAALALPVDALGTEYFVTTYRGGGLVETDRSEFLVAGQLDDTRVTITPKGSVLRPGGGVAQAGVPFEVTLQRGQGVRIEGLSRNIDLTGTRIQSDRPISVLNGNKCTNIPSNKNACDHIFETAHPVHAWGTSALVTNLPFRQKGSIYRVLAAEDGTEVRLDGALQTTLNRGQFFETPSLPGSHRFEANRPIFVTQYMTGHSEDQPFPGFSIGDPSMVNMIPPDQYLNEHTFATVGGNQFDFHFLSVIAPDSSLGSVLLDGAPMDSDLFAPIGTTGFSAAVVEIEEGSHTISSPEPHGITVEGMDTVDSYIYPGGARMEFLNPFCGDGKVNLSFEQCDGRDFKGVTCAAFGFPSGSLQCNAQCRIDTSECSGLAVEDADGDGFPVTEDCDDRDASVNPGQTEVPGNGKDDDCNPGTPDSIPPGAVTCRLVADRGVYSATDLVGLDAVLESSGGLLTLTGLTASLDVHAIGGDGIFATARDLAPLPPGARLEHPYSFAAFGHAPGDYEAVLTLAAGGSPAAQCSAVFAIDSSAETGAGLAGDLTLDPEAVETGTASSARYTVENRGNAALPGLGLRVLLLDASTGALLAELAETATLASGGAFDGNRPLSTTGLQPASYLVVLLAELADGTRLTLDSANLRVEAVSNTPPDCSNAIAVPSTVWPPNHKLVDMTLEGVTDAESDPLALTFTGIFQDEPTNAQGDGNQCPDATGVGTSTAKVRAERSGNGNGRVYHLRFTADDGRGGTCQGEVEVCVPKNGKGGCVDEGAVFDTGVCQ